jgi:hypothetical protein
VIYHAPTPDQPLDQADIVEACPVLTLTTFDLDALKPPKITVSPCRVIVLT